MSAPDFIARGLALQAQAGQSRLFTDMAQIAIPNILKRFDTSGHSAAGVGAGTYVCDALCTEELLAAHPRFAVRTATGRIFRLLPDGGCLAVEQGGAVGEAGHNAQPAIQAAIDYAEAAGASEVHFTAPHYELWAPQRSSPYRANQAVDGRPIVIRRSLVLRGTHGRRTLLDFRAMDGGDPESGWQEVADSTSNPAPAVWRGGAVYVLGNLNSAITSPLLVERVELHRLIFQGNRQRTAAQGSWPADPVTGDGWDGSDKGFAVHDTHVGDIVLEDTDFLGWKGELLYLGGYPPRSLRLERCRLLTTNGAALNPGIDVPLIARDCEFGDAFQAWEDSGKRSAFLANCLFRDSHTMTFGSGRANGAAIGPTYIHSLRDEAAAPPIMQLEGCEIRNIRNAVMGGWIRGRLRTTDSMVVIRGLTYGALQDVDLELEAWLDQQDGLSPLVLNGPPTLETALPNRPAPPYVQPPRNVHVRLRCLRSALAAANGRHWHDVQWNGLIDPSCRIELDVAEVGVNRLPKASDNPPLSFPLVRVNQARNTSGGGAAAAVWLGPLAASGVLVPRGPVCAAGVASETTLDLTLATAPLGGAAFGYAEGQPFRLCKRGATGALRFVKGASPGFVVRETRVLDHDHDWIEFSWNRWANRWEEAGFFTSA